jgi:hypothetical protein
LKRNELVILWTFVTVIILCLAFPPYGYDHKYTYQSTSHPTESIQTVPFRFLGYAFVLSTPPRDRLLEEIDKFYDKQNNSYSVIYLSRLVQITAGVLWLSIDVTINGDRNKTKSQGTRYHFLYPSLNLHLIISEFFLTHHM